MPLMTRERSDTAVCPRCESHVGGDARFCGCGAPTSKASFEERSKYELEQYRAYKASLSA